MHWQRMPSPVSSHVTVAEEPDEPARYIDPEHLMWKETAIVDLRAPARVGQG